ncbi:hypothetical protein LTT66_31755 [Nocardia gipuzkoensis]|uniref:hypothetical protein n=1 Tax=Nocardia gipuzkoensis TaxID=2749991 RepID=UPI001E34E994|nr:hypothetical protein [Nocardia gipuzkoensis]UGT67724.1 hypothetical protein LTT66_31755 [Nocardia gipuzkoensis]
MVEGESPNLGALESAEPEIFSVVARRSCALLLLIDLYGFERWVEGKWEKAVRAEALIAAHRSMDPLHPEDLHAMETAYKDAIKKL